MSEAQSDQPASEASPTSTATALPPPQTSTEEIDKPIEATTTTDLAPDSIADFVPVPETALSTSPETLPAVAEAAPTSVSSPTFSPTSMSAPSHVPPPVSTATSPTVPWQAPVSESSSAPLPAHVSAPTPPLPTTVPVGTSVPMQNPSITNPPPPPSMPQYLPGSNGSSNHPSMQLQQLTGSPLSSGLSSMQSTGQYNPNYSPSMAQVGIQGGQMSYQLPGNSRSRAHQREVKRRTKTGCLTCRKRRIKCDEGHPVCRNCVKSKRECLGYDPVFRQQAGPSDIRPAGNSQPPLGVNSQENHNSYSSAPPGYVPASGQTFAPSVQSDSSIQSFDQSNSNRQGPVEPSIEESDTMSIMASVQDTIDGSISQPIGTPDLAAAALMPLSGQVGRQEKVKIQDLLALQGIAPPSPYPIVPIQQARLDQIQTVYLHTYAPAIDRFLETRWFRDKGLSQLLTNAQLMAQYSALIDAFNDQKIDDPTVRGRVESFEASVVWDTMSICRSARNLVRNGNTEPLQEYDLLTTANRFDILEALITDDHLKDNPLRRDLAREPPPNPKSLQDQLRSRSLNFWNCIGHFLTLHDNEASSAKEIDDTLARCRALLDQIENRDVIYSMAIGRHLGQRLSDFHPRNRPENSSDERNANTKLLVAQRFIEDESKDKGTTQVVKRLCGMVHRLWELKNILLPHA